MAPGDLPISRRPIGAQAAIEADHLGVGPGLVDEDQLLRIKTRLAGDPALAAIGDVGPVTFAGVLGFF